MAGLRWLRVHGLAQARAARAAWPAHAGPLPLVGPQGAAETLGPGWPRAMRDGLIPQPGEDTPPGRACSVLLAVDCGAAVGFALAVLDDWAETDTEAVSLVVALADSVPEVARAAVSDRAEARRVAVVDAGVLRILDVEPEASPVMMVEQARALASTQKR